MDFRVSGEPSGTVTEARLKDSKRITGEARTIQSLSITKPYHALTVDNRINRRELTIGVLLGYHLIVHILATHIESPLLTIVPVNPRTASIANTWKDIKTHTFILL